MSDPARDRFGGAKGGLREAMRLAADAAKRKPTDADRTPPSTFPATPASRAARAFDKGRRP